MQTIDLLSFTAVASLVLAIVAIVLSILFYRMSSQLSESTKEAALRIGASVERLEALFEKLYTDTFSMTRDTVSAMQKQLWPEGNEAKTDVVEEVKKRADEKIEALRKETQDKFAEVLSQQHPPQLQEGVITDSMKSVIDTAIFESREVDKKARGEALTQIILGFLSKTAELGVKPTTNELAQHLYKLYPDLRLGEMFTILQTLEKDGAISLSGNLASGKTIITRIV